MDQCNWKVGGCLYVEAESCYEKPVIKYSCYALHRSQGLKRLVVRLRDCLRKSARACEQAPSIDQG